jgi:AcrR family transcriptional regulator
LTTTSQHQRASHRQRLIEAMASSIERSGYRETTVADVVRIARTSRRTFYQHFEDREACFLALFDAINEQLIEQIAAAVQPEQSLEEQVDSALDAYIDGVTAQPALYQSFVHELPSLGRPGADRLLAVTERFAELLVALAESTRREQPALRSRPLSIDTAIMIVGGLRELAVIYIRRGRDLHELRASGATAIKAILAGAVLE